MIRPLLAALLALASLSAAPAAQDVDALVAELVRKRDMAEAEEVFDLANIKTRAAMEGLLEVYDNMESIFMRRAVLQGLAYMDGVADAEQPALQKIMDVATEARDRELREGAVDALATCNHLGKAFLAMIVEAPADDEIRERAMRYHVRSPRSEDLGWYREFWNASSPQDFFTPARPRDEDEEPELRQLRVVRQLAFEAQAPSLSATDLRVGAVDLDWRIRERALIELEGKDDPELEELAERAWGNFAERPLVRLTAAQILLRMRGNDFAEDIIDYGGRIDTPHELRMGLAELVAGIDDEDVRRDLVRAVGKGKTNEKLFALWAVAELPSDRKLDRDLRKGLKDRDEDVIYATLLVLAQRGDEEAIEDVEKIWERTRDVRLKSAALDCLCALRANDSAWVAQVLNESQSEDPEVRNAAIDQLAAAGGSDHTDVFLQALEHPLWSTRVAALRALEGLRQRPAVSAIIERMPEEQGRMAILFGESLWRLTGESFGTNPQRWAMWWEENGTSFEFMTSSQLRRREREREEQRLRQISRSTFFGIRIESHRVTFILDVSGSMEAPTKGRYVGEEGDTRIEVARRELLAALEGLDQRSFFNVIAFSDRAQPWSEEIAERNDETLEEAREFVEDFTAGGATNLYASLEMAFADPDVDTIYVMSDGEPTVEPTDPALIRERVQRWNLHRGVKIHAVAVGGSLQILEWLADDTGGTYVQYP